MTAPDVLDAARVAAVRDYVASDGGASELDAVVRLAAAIAGVGTATVNVIDERVQRQIATVGFAGVDGPRQDSMCSTSLDIGGFVHLTDAAQDPRFSANPYVDGREDSVRFYAAAPLLTPEGHSLGTLCVFDAAPRTLSRQQVHDLQDLAALVVALFDRQRQERRQAQAAAEAQQARQAAELAKELQATLLPQRLPSFDRVQVASGYQAAATDAAVGGDWYDAVRTDGRLVFVIGDVQGHSGRAAALMGQLRTAVRAYVSEGHPPAAALERTNGLLADLGADLSATCCVLELDERTGEVSVASAGHPAPLVRTAEGAVRLFDVQPGPPLGVDGAAAYTATRSQLSGPSRLLLYTDGLAPCRTEPGTAPLAAMLARSAAAAPAELAEALLTGASGGDDAALLVLDYAGPPPEWREARLELAADMRAVREARTCLRDTLSAWGLDDLVDGAELVVSELVTNALLHTGAAATLLLRHDMTLRHDVPNANVLIGVEDRSTRQPQPREADEDALGGRGMAIVEAIAARWWVAPHGDGKTVWVELALDVGTDARSDAGMA